MLVASASVGLIAPIGVQANDINIEGMNSYTSSKSSSKKQQFNSKTFANELATVNEKIDGLETQLNEFQAGSFSDTTTFDGKVNFTVGALSYDGTGTDTVSNEATLFQYMWQGNLNTSFTGDDNLYVRLKTGNASSWTKDKDHGTYLSSSKGNSNVIKVDKIWYSFPVGESNTVFVGPLIENYYMHGTTPSIYKPVLKAFTLGGNGAAYGASTDTGAGWSYKADNGFAVSSNIGTKSHSTQKVDGSYIDSGLLTDETKTSWATQIGLTKEQYAVSAMLNLKYNGWSDSYFTAGSAQTGNTTNYGLRAWWRPLETGTATPQVSLGYDYTTIADVADDVDSTNAYFVGLSWLDTFSADDRIGIAFGQPQTREDNTADPFMWEAYYSFKPNDSVTITPTIFAASDANGSAGEDYTGAVIETQFKF